MPFIPQAEFSEKKRFVAKYEQLYGAAPDTSAAQAYNAAKLLLKAAEGSDLSSEKLGRNLIVQVKKRLGSFEKLVQEFETLIGEQQTKEVRVSVAGLRQKPSKDGETPADNPILAVLKKGDKVVEQEKWGDWIYVKSSSNPMQAGWIHRMLVKDVILPK